ncbi:MAG: RNA 3'-terminal phosphate cyclase domain-containing protein, partial [Olpidium bornovanus]
MPPMVVIDSSIHDGGGQLLRNAISFSCVLRRPVTITRFRSQRNPPGLRPPHVACLDHVLQLCPAASIEGAEVGSQEVVFRAWDCPAPPEPGRGCGRGQRHYVVDVNPGAITLVFHAALVPLLFAPTADSTTVTYLGCTDASNAPPVDYVSEVFLKVIRAATRRPRSGGAAAAAAVPKLAEVEVLKRVVGIRDGGAAKMTVYPLRSLPALELLDRGRPERIRGRVFYSRKASKRAAEAARKEALRAISERFARAQSPPPPSAHGNPADRTALPSADVMIDLVRDTNCRGDMDGISAFLWLETTSQVVMAGFSVSSGAGGLEDEAAYSAIGLTAAEQLIRNWDQGGCVDEYLQDQLIYLMALADGVSKVLTGPLTPHTRGGIYVSEKMTEARFTVEPAGGIVGKVFAEPGVDDGKTLDDPRAIGAHKPQSALY